LLNGIITGFAVYIGSHTGQRIVDRLKDRQPKLDTEEQKLIDNIIKVKGEKNG